MGWITAVLLSAMLIGNAVAPIGISPFYYRQFPPPCDGINSEGLICEFPTDCKIGEVVYVNCTSHEQCPSPISRTNVEGVCLFCWQLPIHEYYCKPVENCSTSSPKLHLTECRPHPHVFCMGQFYFYKRVRCNWSSGHMWSTTMLLSVFLGGFGADRFYLGLWKSAIGKMVSFGGLGVWTIIDVILIAVGYLKPADGSHYM